MASQMHQNRQAGRARSVRPPRWTARYRAFFPRHACIDGTQPSEAGRGIEASGLCGRLEMEVLIHTTRSNWRKRSISLSDCLGFRCARFQQFGRSTTWTIGAIPRARLPKASCGCGGGITQSLPNSFRRMPKRYRMAAFSCRILVLAHCDLHGRNILFRGNKLNCVIDWEEADIVAAPLDLGKMLWLMGRSSRGNFELSDRLVDIFWRRAEANLAADKLEALPFVGAAYFLPRASHLIKLESVGRRQLAWYVEWLIASGRSYPASVARIELSRVKSRKNPPSTRSSVPCNVAGSV